MEVQCIYEGAFDRLVRSMLDAEVEATGKYETLENEQPRLVAVEDITIVRPPSEQLNIDLPH